MKQSIFLFVLIVVMGGANLAAQEYGAQNQPVPGTGGAASGGTDNSPVDSAELQRNLGPVEFINNNASPTVVNTRRQIWEIGNRLGTAVRNNTGEAGGRASYFVRHNIYPPELDKLDADVFGLGPSAGVDTIRNLRWIIQGYLEGAYNYSTDDAALLAEFITIYNAVYRKNRVYFASRYKTPLMNTLQPEGNEGLSTRWNEWAGQTLMLIPLRTAADGSLSAIDTSAITSEDVINELRKDDDRGIEQRQAMVDLKEREAEAASQKAELQREAITAEEKRLADEKARIAAEQAALEQAKQEGAISDEEAAKKEAELAAQEEAARQAEEDLQKQREAEAENIALAEKKTEEAQAERQEIAKDQAETLGLDQQQGGPPPSLLGVRLNPGASTGRVVRVNANNAAQMQSSELNTLNARSVTFVGGKLLAVAASGGKFYLVEIDQTTLQVTKQGADELNKDSIIWVNGANLYAIASSGGKNYIARFDMNLALQARSTGEVHPLATVIVQGDKALTQNPSGAVVILNAQTLVE
ncbi:MAG: hypothetical protein LBG72_02065 [Spirochaetaceae bacterium]|jgi:hypothetical protein|nr:hypothetical protein [Spirochaetaceae bacterium]